MSNPSTTLDSTGDAQVRGRGRPKHTGPKIPKTWISVCIPREISNKIPRPRSPWIREAIEKKLVWEVLKNKS